ncbi:MAG: DNA-binding response regulator [Planctomycetota bacterium]|nr:MAG: DNA-binding response regulator [Planctomycetota bacterium]
MARGKHAARGETKPGQRGRTRGHREQTEAESDMATSEATDTIRVLVVDDHAMIREGLAQLIGEEAEFEVVGTAADGRSALRLARKLNPDVVLMDLAMPELNGLEATRRIVKALPQTRVLALSMYMDRDYISRALEAGVAGYLLKDSPPEELYEALRRVAAGERFFSSRIPATVLKGAELGRRRRRGPELTHREREVLKLLAEGHTVKEIAELLKLSQKTVDTHKTNLMRKLDIHNRVELVRYAIEEKIIQL